MTSPTFHSNDGLPLDDLSPELRRAVEVIVHNKPPEGLTEQILRELQRQGATTANARPRSYERRRARRIAAWGLVAASAIAMFPLLFHARSFFQPDMPKPALHPSAQLAIDGDLPTAWAYHRAIGQSSEAPEALLDRHARHSLRSEPNLSRMHVFLYSSQPMP
jgi:hypothetical protein